MEIPVPKLETFGPHQGPKQFVLCFDGTGNKFAGDASDTNLVKIYRMLDRSQSHQYHYYQPGIGTYVTSHTLGSKNRLERIKSSYKKAKDAALGSSFDEHVLGGYKFLMRYYAPGDDIYFFGFSRGSYTARFLAEMLDYIGLLQPGNEELIRFAWKTFAKWQQRRDATEHDHQERHKLFRFMKAFRETFSRPVSRVKFMGLFDTVNSVPMFENAWMERSKFPYTAQSTARVIRHAVSIDERRAKFRQDLISEVKPLVQAHAHTHKLRRLLSRDDDHNKAHVPEIMEPPNNEERRRERRASRQETYGEEMRYRAPSSSPARRPSVVEIPTHNGLLTDRISLKSAVSRNSLRVPSLNIPGQEEDEDKQDIQEVWFPGQHGDVGGGWKLNPNDLWPLSHIPLVWMVKEAQLVGLEFDPEKLKRFHCYEEPTYENLGYKETTINGDISETNKDPFHETYHRTMDTGIAHDCLTYGGGLSFFSTLSWRLMEYMPFRRMDLQADGSWKPIRWPLPCGEVRDIPENAQIHICAIHRMKIDPNYRPGNLIVGGWGRGVKRAPEKYGIGEWDICMHEGDPVRQTYIRKKGESVCLDESHVN
ncbi:hypothetical protein N7448_008115 [Penicillium atrosanguineum]|uniref:T6SS Phospholipase effector Tle1-like catalytic domain-containing protein n=1 Tax=Penicillium atrosanguineum TaxID=1132637 RepID=A0A9W9KXQ4_9EURO|nr:hypothetical protein N7448_008115 [Penicillium atrosanguineum]KAJ5147538.1 hypothetical protein N7526_000890 [Penicillium atrosanguineum]KAJ5331153.1 hypothetical protein N7476_000936 [Penicillium atrosanguineum]